MHINNYLCTYVTTSIIIIIIIIINIFNVA